jgi:hypothetical protein
MPDAGLQTSSSKIIHISFNIIKAIKFKEAVSNRQPLFFDLRTKEQTGPSVKK